MQQLPGPIPGAELPKAALLPPDVPKAMPTPEQFAASRVNTIANSFGNVFKAFGGIVPAFLTFGALYLMWQGMKTIITGKNPLKSN